nr:hypothetical protein [Tanacetum cinerariifolium]
MKSEATELCDEKGNEFIVNKQRVKPYQKEAAKFDVDDEITLEDEGGVTVKDSEWFKEKMLLAQAQEVGVVLDEEQHYFLANDLKDNNDCEELQLQATASFKSDNIDTYDSDCDDEYTTNTIFMTKFSSIGSLNDDTVVPRYDSDTLSHVPHYDTYHHSDALNSNTRVVIY